MSSVCASKKHEIEIQQSHSCNYFRFSNLRRGIIQKYQQKIMHYNNDELVTNKS